MTGIDKAIRAVGSQQKLAELLGVKQQAVSVWARKGYAPITRVVEIEAITGVSRTELVGRTVLDAVDVMRGAL